MSLLAQIVDGELDAADVLFLVGAALFLVATVINAMARDITSTLTNAGFAALSFGWFVL